MYTPSSKKPCEASRGDPRTQRWSLEDAVVSALIRASPPRPSTPRPCILRVPVQQEFLSSAWSSGRFYEPATADKWRRKTSLWSSAQLSKSDFRSAGGRPGCFNPLWEGTTGSDSRPSWPCLPATLALSFPNGSSSAPQPCSGLTLPSPSIELPQRSQIPV